MLLPRPYLSFSWFCVSGIILLGIFLCCRIQAGEEAGGGKGAVDSMAASFRHPDEKAWRKGRYQAFENIGAVSRRLKLGFFGMFDNPTGIYYPPGATVAVTLSGEPACPVKILLVDYFENGYAYQSHTLVRGENRFRADYGGLAYVCYDPAMAAGAPEVDIQMDGGMVNGVFKAGDSNETWKKLLKHASCPFMELYGYRGVPYGVFEAVLPGKRGRAACLV